MKTRIGRILKMVTMRLMTAASRDPARDQDVEEPHPDGRHRHRQERGAVTEAVEERAQGRADEHPVERVAGHRAGPEPDRGVESRVVPETGLGVDEHTGVELGFADREVLEHEREHQHPGAGDSPGDQRAEDPGRDPEPCREREHPRPHHAADHHRGQCGHGHLRDAAGRRLDCLVGRGGGWGAGWGAPRTHEVSSVPAMRSGAPRTPRSARPHLPRDVLADVHLDHLGGASERGGSWVSSLQPLSRPANLGTAPASARPDLGQGAGRSSPPT